jgi:hypothetical protein
VYTLPALRHALPAAAAAWPHRSVSHSCSTHSAKRRTMPASMRSISSMNGFSISHSAKSVHACDAEWRDRAVIRAPQPGRQLGRDLRPLRFAAPSTCAAEAQPISTIDLERRSRSVLDLERRRVHRDSVALAQPGAIITHCCHVHPPSRSREQPSPPSPHPRHRNSLSSSPLAEDGESGEGLSARTRTRTRARVRAPGPALTYARLRASALATLGKGLSRLQIRAISTALATLATPSPPSPSERRLLLPACADPAE